ncbi:DUF1097 domain-containing protein [Terrisporobacter petrolearius]|uniref:DUF1097 domain-containing protein n=1 Tax=Terrisporobacter petrolearius TaxID=1460447 RepID=UPI0031CC3D59
MKKMSYICALGIVTGVLCGIWAWGSGSLGLFTWAGFAGCTTYFASGHHGVEGLKKTILPNMAGVLCGMTIIFLSGLVPVLGTTGVWCAIVTFVMCIIGKSKWFDFIPGTFMGCFTTFAAAGNWMLLVPSLLLGALLGISCDKGGDWFYKVVTKNNANDSDVEAE